MSEDGFVRFTDDLIAFPRVLQRIGGREHDAPEAGSFERARGAHRCVTSCAGAVRKAPLWQQSRINTCRFEELRSISAVMNAASMLVPASRPCSVSLTARKS